MSSSSKESDEALVVTHVYAIFKDAHRPLPVDVRGLRAYDRLSDAVAAWKPAKGGKIYRALLKEAVAVRQLFLKYEGTGAFALSTRGRGLYNWTLVPDELIEEERTIARMEDALSRPTLRSAGIEEPRSALGRAMGQQIRDTMKQQSLGRRLLPVSPVVDAAIQLHASTPLSKKP